jgi:L-lactate dehydrogenase complex protein LldF
MNEDFMITSKFKQDIADALKNPDLQVALERVTSSFKVRRNRAFQSLDFLTMQSHVRSIKEKNISNLKSLIEQFKAKASEEGMIIHEAQNAEQAREIVADLAGKRNASLIVKGKSNLSEEIGLNSYLEGKGIRVVETDLGEWIIQLAGERPSHLLGPALHKTRASVAKLFNDVLGENLDPDDIPKMVRVARKHLRELFISADMGITGANILVAETGSLVICSNEGNVRLVSSLPPIHVAIVGVEKVVETLDEANDVIRILGRSAAGHPMTSYVSYITAPSRSGDIELTPVVGMHGPEEVHVILVDNGRYKTADTPFCESMFCLKCGACLNVCPSYRSVGGHVYGGKAYMGGIGSVLTSIFSGIEEAAEINKLCTGCGKCKEVCPCKIDVPVMIAALREQVAAKEGLPLIKKAMISIVGDNDKLNTVANLATKLGGMTAVLKLFPGIKDKDIDIPKLQKPFLTQAYVKGHRLENVEAKAHCVLYGGCLLNYVYPETGVAVIEVLEKLGYAVAFPEGQVCCGAPARYAGDRGSAVTMAEKNVMVLANTEGPIIYACPTCGMYLAELFPGMVAPGHIHEMAEEIAKRTVGFGDFIARHVQDAFFEKGPMFEAKITYHESCHMRQNAGGLNHIRQLIKGIKGAELVEMKNPESCCGFGGSFTIDFPDVSLSIAKRKAEDIIETRADYVVSDCLACTYQIGRMLKRLKSPIQVLHIADLISRSLNTK